MMPGLPELLVIFAVLVLLFGATKIPSLFGAFGEGIRNFKKGLHSESDEAPPMEDNKRVPPEDKQS
ncbi:MAG: twin-arginine translocase TatA/TatE family subunit [Zetaproteobacteria bacterium]|nr:twin-arginine translocase TatA/TatE family subunit [Zetaproteobacteria bacterium]